MKMENTEEILLPLPPQKKNVLELPPPKNVVLLGSEYTTLTPPRKPTKKEKKKIDHTIDNLKGISEDEAKFIYEGAGAAVYLPTFKEYLNTFFDVIKQETKIKSDFRAFKDTRIYEKFMLNVSQFSAAKSVAVNKLMKEQLFNEDGIRKGFSQFKADCKGVTDIVNDVWFRTEYDTSVRMAVAGEQFRSYRDDADLFPYWIYLETTSANPRESHLELVGNIYRIGDAEGDAVFPPGSWNCSCGSEQIDDNYLSENNKSARTNEEAEEDLQHIDPQFRTNPADSGLLPKEGHSYFQALPNANDADGSTFGITGTTAQSTKLKAIGLHQFVSVVHDWKIKYHTDNLHEIIFKNEDLLSNVLFNNKSFTNIAKHAQGTDNLPETIINPSEVWSRWNDVDTQQNVIRCYIKGNYVVETLNSVITDAHLVDDVNRFRKGVIIL